MIYFEDQFPGWFGGVNFRKLVTFTAGATFNSGTVNFTGSTVTGLTAGVENIVATSANAFTVGQTTANPALNINTNTASSATGLTIVSAAAGSGLALATISSGSAENLTIDAKGSGTVTINGTATGIVVLPAGTTIGGSVPLTSTITSSSANALAVGPNGTTNPVFNVNAATGSQATGVSVVGAAAGSGVNLLVTSSGSNENLSVTPKGTGNFNVPGRVILGTTINSAAVLSVGASGATNPVFSVNTSASSVATGLTIIGQAAASGVALNVISSGTNENLTISGKGTGIVGIATMVSTHTPTAINSTATATAAQVQTGYITSTSAAAVTITMPTGTLLGAAIGAVQGTVMDLYIDNTAGANTVTMAVGVNAILSAAAAANAGSQGLLTVPSGATGQACFRLMFSSATAYTITRIA